MSSRPTIKSIALSYDPAAKGYWSDSSGLLGFRTQRLRVIVWARLDESPIGYTETGSTVTPEGAAFVPFE